MSVWGRINLGFNQEAKCKKEVAAVTNGPPPNFFVVSVLFFPPPGTRLRPAALVGDAPARQGGDGAGPLLCSRGGWCWPGARWQCRGWVCFALSPRDVKRFERINCPLRLCAESSPPAPFWWLNAKAMAGFGGLRWMAMPRGLTWSSGCSIS